MGLGKTIQAIAALCHLKSTGQTHFLVVCPASVLINWTREVRQRSDLRAHTVYGPERDRQLRLWHERGDVAVTTFETLRHVTEPPLRVQPQHPEVPAGACRLGPDRRPGPVVTARISAGAGLLLTPPRRGLAVLLRLCERRVHQQRRVRDRPEPGVPAGQHEAGVPGGGVVPPLGEGEPLGRPGDLRRRMPDGVVEDRPVPQAGEVRVTAVVRPQLADTHVAAVPHRGELLVEVEADRASRDLPGEHPLAGELVGHPPGELVGRAVGLLDGDRLRRPGVGLIGHQRPVVRAAEPGGDVLVGAGAVALDDLALLRGEVEFLPADVDPAPREVVASGVHQLVEPFRVRGEEHQHVPVRVRGRAAPLGRLPDEAQCLGVVGGLAVWSRRVQQDQPHPLGVGDVGRGLGRDVDSDEPAAVPALAGVEPGDDLLPHLLGVVAQGVGVVGGGAGDGRLGVEPVPAALDVQVGGALAQQIHGRAEVPDRVAGDGGAQPHPLPFDAAMGGAQRGRGPHEDRPGEAPGYPAGAERGPVGVDPDRGGPLAVDVAVDDRLPPVGQVLRDLAVDPGDVQRDRAGQDERGRVLARPQGVHHGADQAQDAAGALEPLERRPVLVEQVEQLWVDRVGGLDGGRRRTRWR